MNELQQVRDLSKQGLSQYKISHQLGIKCSELAKLVGDDIISLRNNGKSIREIVEITGYSKANISKWVSKVPNNEEIKLELQRKFNNSQRVSIDELDKRRIERNKGRSKVVKSQRKDSINRKRLRAKKKLLLVELCGGKCCNCGYNEFSGGLEFHHIDESKKLFTIRSNDLSRPAVEITSEVNKCAMVCANCHRIVHADEDIHGSLPSVKLVKCNIKVEDISHLFT